MKFLCFYIFLLTQSLFAVTYVVPEHFRDIDATDRNITLRWSDVDNEIGYKIYQFTRTSSVEIGSVSADTTEFVVTKVDTQGYLVPLSENTSYSFAVTALYGSHENPDESAFSNIIDSSTTHTWQGILLQCLNNSSHIPTRTELESITIFNCSNRYLNSPIEAVQDLKNIQELYLDHNDIAEALAVWIGDFISLIKLNLSYNNFTGTVPKEIGDLINLEMLNLGHNSITGYIPHEIGNLIKLEAIFLSYNDISGNIPNEIATLNNLVDIRLFNNRLVGKIPENIGNLAGLKNLNLSENLLTGSIPLSLCQAKQTLTTLYLDKNHLSGEIPTCITTIALQNRGLELTDNCYLYTNEQSVIDFINTKAVDESHDYDDILRTNGNCLCLVPVINYLMD